MTEGSEGYPSGCFGWLLGSAGTVLVIIALTLAGLLEFPAWWVDVSPLLGGPVSSGPDVAARNAATGPALLLLFAWMASLMAATAAGGLVAGLADRVRARYDPALVIAEVTAASVTVVFFVALGLAGNAWGVLATVGMAVLLAAVGVSLARRRRGLTR